MKKSVGFLFAMLIWIAVMPAVAQDDGSCEAESIVERVDSIYTEYQAIRTTDDSLTAFNDVENYYNSLGDILDECRNIVELAASGVIEVGSGTFDDPYAFDYFGDTGRGYLLKVSRIIRPADQYISRYDDRASEGWEYVAFVIDVQCVSPSENFCEIDYGDFEMVGDNGVVYGYGYRGSSSSSLDTKLLAGGEDSGSVFFLVESDDSKLRLVFSPGYSSNFVIYSGEPAPGQIVEEPVDDTVTITSTTNINVRSGPGTSHSIVGSFRNGEQATAVGRNTAGTWVQMQSGWVFAQLVRVDGNIMSLSITSP